MSTDEQAASGLGLDAQTERITAAATLHGWPPEDIQWCRDEGVSGTVSPDARPHLGEVLSRIGAGDVLVAAKLDRIGRSALDVLALADRAKREGWHLILLDLGLDTTTAMGSAFLGMMAVMAQMERDLIAERTRDALAAAKRRGVRLGAPVRLHDELRHFMHQRRSEGLTFQAIADEVNQRGWETTSGTPWSRPAVARVVRSVGLDRAAREALEAV